MFCSRCGAALVSTSAFCHACGAPTGIGVDAAGPLKRPGLVTLLAVLQFIAAAVMLPLGFVALATSVGRGGSDAALTQAAGVAWLVFGALSLAAGIGLWKLKGYGRIIQIVLACFGLLAIPLGTIVSALILYYMLRPGIRALFSGKSASELTPVERAEIAAVTQGSPAVTAIIVVFVALGLVAMIGIVAAIAVPGLLRARMAGNEAAAIGSMRSIVSAEAAYAAAAGGGAYAISLATLAASCPDAAQGFISPELGQDPSVKSGFTIRLQSAGAAPGPNDCNGKPTELDFYATGVPVTPGTTGQRAFSASAAGAVFYDPSGVAPSRAATLEGTAKPVW